MRLYNLKTKESAEQLSPARDKLKAVLDQRAASERRVVSLRTAEQRLNDTTFTEAARAAKALSDFDNESGAATLAWAKNALSKDDAPQVDADRRQSLIIAKQTSAENAAAANAAKIQLSGDIQIEARASKGLQPAIEQTVAEIIFESTEHLLTELQEAQRDVARRKHRLDQALRAVIDMAHSTGSKGTFNLMEGLAERFRTAGAPAFEASTADRAMWEAFAARLRTDAAAELEA